MSYKDAKAEVVIVYEGKDISIDLKPYLMSMSYHDKAVGEADELTIQVRDNSHLWKFAWNPKKGDTITAEIRQGNKVLKCGTFEVDTPRFSGSREGGHIATICALSAGVKQQVRTKSSFAHEGKTLKQIAQKIADKYHYKVQGLTRDFPIQRVTQWHESDLGFLHRIAEEFGYLFTLKGDVLVFTYVPDLNTAAGAVVLRMKDCESYNIVDKVMGVYVKGQNRYYNAKQKKTIVSDVTSQAGDSADVHRTRGKVDSEQHGLLMVGGRLYKKNMGQVEIDCTVPGDVGLISGNNAVTEGFFTYNSTYMITEAMHTVTLEGSYKTSPRLKKIVKNNDAATGEKKPKVQEIDISGEARAIYDALYSVVSAGNLVVYESLRARVNLRINTALAAIRSKGDRNLAELADEWQNDWNKITTEVIGGYGDMGLGGDREGGFGLAVSDAAGLREKVQPYTQKF